MSDDEHDEQPAEETKTAKSRKQTSVGIDEYALLCWLRLHPDVAKTYGIKRCDGSTSLGSMMLQLLEAMGMDVKWHDEYNPPAKGVANVKWASYIKSVTRRPGARQKQLAEWPEVAPPPKAAVIKDGKSLGKLPCSAFPALQKAKSRPAKAFSSCGNRIAPAAEVAFVERRCAVDFIERSVRHGGRLPRGSQSTPAQG